MREVNLENVWPGWQIVRTIGQGGYGVVYEAVHEEAGISSKAAVKVISIPKNPSEMDSLRSEGMTKDQTRTYLRGVVDSFVSEIRLMNSFKGMENIVSVEDYRVIERQNEIGWDIYIRMELLTPLPMYFSDKTLDEKEIIKLGIDLCTALEVCARQNVIHRDIKPDNIFVNAFGAYKLGDFGIARTLEGTETGLSQKGTSNYIAPEVFRGTKYDARVDVYSLGLVLYYLANNRTLPFLDAKKKLHSYNERLTAVNRRLGGEQLPPPCNASPQLSEVILMACSADPQHRFGTATAMKNALLSLQTSSITPAAVSDLNKTTRVRPAPQSSSEPTVLLESPKAVETGRSQQQFVSPKAPRKKTLAIILAIIGGVILLSIPCVVYRVLNNMDDKQSSVVRDNEETRSSTDTKDDSNSSNDDANLQESDNEMKMTESVSKEAEPETEEEPADKGSFLFLTKENPTESSGYAKLNMDYNSDGVNWRGAVTLHNRYNADTAMATYYLGSEYEKLHLTYAYNREENYDSDGDGTLSITDESGTVIYTANTNPLNCAKEVDLDVSNIEYITIVFESFDEGTLMLKDLVAVKEWETPVEKTNVLDLPDEYDFAKENAETGLKQNVDLLLNDYEQDGIRWRGAVTLHNRYNDDTAMVTYYLGGEYEKLHLLYAYNREVNYNSDGDGSFTILDSKTNTVIFTMQTNPDNPPKEVDIDISGVEYCTIKFSSFDEGTLMLKDFVAMR